MRTRTVFGWFFLTLMVILSGGLTGCATAPKRDFGKVRLEPAPGPAMRGQASWYGDTYRGKRTASGERFNPDDFTGAHRTLSFGTIIEVRNLKNNRKVLVEINDRGPSVKGRIIDLSERAARELGMIGAGVVPVEIRIMRRRRG